MKDDLAQRLVQSLKDAGINFVTYLPETRLSQIIPIIRDDPDMELVPVASEAEAVTIAAGATLGGKQAAVYLENTGLYVSSYSLLTFRCSWSPLSSVVFPISAIVFFMQPSVV